MLAAAGGVLRSPEAIRGAMATFSEMSIDEFVIDPTVNDADHVDRLAEVAR